MNGIFRAKHGDNKGEWVKWAGYPFLQAITRLVHVSGKPKIGSEIYKEMEEEIRGDCEGSAEWHEVKNPFHLRLPDLEEDEDRDYLFKKVMPAACLGGAYFDLCYSEEGNAECPETLRMPMRELDNGSSARDRDLKDLVYEAKHELGKDYDEDIIKRRFDREHSNSRAVWRLDNVVRQRLKDDYSEEEEKAHFSMPSASQRLILTTPLTYALLAIQIVGDTPAHTRYEPATALRVGDAQMIFEWADQILSRSDEVWRLWTESVLSAVRRKVRKTNEANGNSDARIPTGKDPHGVVYDYMVAEEQDLKENADEMVSETARREDMGDDSGLAWLASGHRRRMQAFETAVPTLRQGQQALLSGL